MKALFCHFVWSCCEYQDNMKELLETIPTAKLTPTPEDFKNIFQLILTDIVGERYVKKYDILNLQYKVYG